jgi:hypothetical protein
VARRKGFCARSCSATLRRFHAPSRSFPLLPQPPSPPCVRPTLGSAQHESQTVRHLAPPFDTGHLHMYTEVTCCARMQLSMRPSICSPYVSRPVRLRSAGILPTCTKPFHDMRNAAVFGHMNHSLRWDPVRWTLTMSL